MRPAFAPGRAGLPAPRRGRTPESAIPAVFRAQRLSRDYPGTRSIPLTARQDISKNVVKMIHGWPPPHVFEPGFDFFDVLKYE